jgi:hypothetical protein
LVQAAGAPEPAGGWKWNNVLEPTYTNWCSGKPIMGQVELELETRIV